MLIWRRPRSIECGGSYRFCIFGQSLQHPRTANPCNNRNTRNTRRQHGARLSPLSPLQRGINAGDYLLSELGVPQGRMIPAER